MDDSEFALFADSAIYEFEEKQKGLEGKYNFNRFARWTFDPDTETMTFFDKSDNVAMIFDIIEVGTFSHETNTWKWAWCNDSVPQKLRDRALPVKQLKQVTGRDLFTDTEPFPADQMEGWKLTAMAIRHISALGGFRAPVSDGRLSVFLAFTGIKKFA